MAGISWKLVTLETLETGWLAGISWYRQLKSYSVIEGDSLGHLLVQSTRILEPALYYVISNKYHAFY